MVCIAGDETKQRVRAEQLRSLATIYRNMATGTVLLGGVLPGLRYAGTGDQSDFLGANLLLTLLVAGLFVGISHGMLGKAVRLEL